MFDLMTLEPLTVFCKRMTYFHICIVKSLILEAVRETDLRRDGDWRPIKGHKMMFIQEMIELGSAVFRWLRKGSKDVFQLV